MQVFEEARVRDDDGGVNGSDLREVADDDLPNTVSCIGHKRVAGRDYLGRKHGRRRYSAERGLADMRRFLKPDRNRGSPA